MHDLPPDLVERLVEKNRALAQQIATLFESPTEALAVINDTMERILATNWRAADREDDVSVQLQTPQIALLLMLLDFLLANAKRH